MPKTNKKKTIQQIGYINIKDTKNIWTYCNKDNTLGGIGVFIANNDPKNLSERLPEEYETKNQAKVGVNNNEQEQATKLAYQGSKKEDRIKNKLAAIKLRNE
ncbi:778_t:CDS:2, partial [Cetraspora pellucida]